MNYEQKYKNALERARDLMTNQNPPAFDKHLIEMVFPELKEKENEDEKIRKGLIKAVSRIFEGHKLYDTDVTREEEIINAAYNEAEVERQLKMHPQVFEQGFVAGAKWADAHPRWISVEEELPPRWETNPNVSVQVITCKYVDSELQDIDLQRYHFGDDRWLYGDATHWMPFQFPEEGGEHENN